MHSITIQYLTRRTTDIQKKMTLITVSNLQKSQDTFNDFISDLTWRIINTVNSVDEILHQHGESPASLAIRSRRAYQWVLFLSKKENLLMHLDALQRIVLLLPTLSNSCHKKLSRIDFSFYHISPLYKAQKKEDVLKVVVGESFIFSPDRVLSALMKTTLCPSSYTEKATIRNYSTTFEYQRVREQLEYLSIPPESYSRGAHHNLIESFYRVNNTYFNGQLKPPHLVWSNRLTRRKFGHYQEDTHTVLISRTLDQRHTPIHVVDFVMYHELLHKKLGAKKSKNRRYVHTREFKKHESEYADYDKSKNYLNSLTK